MPYIKSEMRQVLEPHIAEIVEWIVYYTDDWAVDPSKTTLALLSGILLKVFTDIHKNFRYVDIAITSGLLINVASEIEIRLPLRWPYRYESYEGCMDKGLLGKPLHDRCSAFAIQIEQLMEEPPSYAGIMNYCATTIALRLVLQASSKSNMQLLCKLPDFFKKLENYFYKKTASPYEKKAITKNGDLSEYILLKKLLLS